MSVITENIAAIVHFQGRDVFVVALRESVHTACYQQAKYDCYKIPVHGLSLDYGLILGFSLFHLFASICKQKGEFCVFFCSKHIDYIRNCKLSDTIKTASCA